MSLSTSASMGSIASTGSGSGTPPDSPVPGVSPSVMTPPDSPVPTLSPSVILARRKAESLRVQLLRREGGALGIGSLTSSPTSSGTSSPASQDHRRRGSTSETKSPRISDSPRDVRAEFKLKEIRKGTLVQLNVSGENKCHEGIWIFVAYLNSNTLEKEIWMRPPPIIGGSGHKFISDTFCRQKDGYYPLYGGECYIDSHGLLYRWTDSTGNYNYYRKESFYDKKYAEHYRDYTFENISKGEFLPKDKYISYPIWTKIIYNNSEIFCSELQKAEVGTCDCCLANIDFFNNGEVNERTSGTRFERITRAEPKSFEMEPEVVAALMKCGLFPSPNPFSRGISHSTPVEPGPAAIVAATKPEVPGSTALTASKS